MTDKNVIGEKFIDITKIIQEKNPKLAKRLPKFLIKLVERIIKINVVNHYIYRWRDNYGLDWVNGALDDFNVKFTISGIENIPKTGNQMVVSNHPLGGFDGIALMSAVGKIRPDLKFPVNDILLKLPGLKPLLTPINKHGSNAENIKIIDKAFASDCILLFFPAGLVSRIQKEGIRDLEWKHTFINKAIKYERDVIPTFIYAYNSNFFYQLSKWRKKLGIKINIEMFFLIRETIKQRNSKIHIHFGKTIPHSTFDKTKNKKAWAQWVKDGIYNMAKEEGYKLK